MSSIGKYEIREKIGSGGFGVVYRGFDPRIHREVAIKTCSSDEEDIRRRFDNEARIAGNLQHRNITTVYDFGHHEGTPYLVQEYLSGEDLDRKIKRKDNLSLPEKLLYLVQIGRGLAFAHDNGVIHRDVKPANIRILEDGTAKIMDFGIAKLAQQETSLTKTGLTVGTAAYLAPEQVTGAPIDCRTDIFSYGVLAFELLTYERPFPGPRISNVLLQIAQQPHTPLRKFWPECPNLAVDVVNRCLQKRPEDRYDDCHALLVDLDRLLDAGRQDREERLSQHTQVVEVAAKTTHLEVSREQPQAAQSTEWRPPAHTAQPAISTQPQPLIPTSPPPAVGPASSGSTAYPKVAPQAPTHHTTPPALPLADMDLGLGQHASSGRRPSRHPERHRTERASPLPWILLGMLVVIIALVVGWQMGVQGIGPISIPTDEIASTTEQVDDTAMDSGSQEELESRESNEGQSPVSSPEESPVREVDVAPPEPEPASLPGILVVTAGWDARMTFEVAGQSHAMDRDRRLELPAGQHEVIFRFTDGDYRTRQTVAIDLEPGQQRSLRSPLQRPGTVRVQAQLGSPQGRVLVDGNDLGSSPIKKILTPGRHRIEILGGSGSTTSAEIDIPSARTVMVTFDLRSGSPPRIITTDN